MEMEATTETTPSGYTGFDIDLVQKFADDADKTLEVKVTPFDGIFAAMDAGNCDAVVQDYPINAYRTTQDENFVITEKIQTDEQYGMAVKKGNTEILDLLDKGLEKAKSDGKYDELYEKYFGEKPPTS